MTAQLMRSMVRIYSIRGEVIGGGFLVSKKHILTCSHVIERALNLPRKTPSIPEGKIYLDFPLLATQTRFIARVVFWLPMNRAQSIEDIAVLKLKNSPPEKARPARLIVTEDLSGDLLQTYSSGHPLQFFGFPNDKPDGVWLVGVWRGLNAKGWVQIDGTGAGYYFESGFGGMPIWDEKLKGVTGMFVAAETKRTPEVKAAFMIPTTMLIKAWPTLEEEGNFRHPGLSEQEQQVIDFFRWIRHLTLPRNQVKQLDQDVQYLENCTDVKSIRNAHHSLATGELEGLASSLLRTLSRISQDVNAALNQESSYNQRLALSAVEDRLDKLSRELNRSNERYAKRFRPIVKSWRQILANHMRELAAAAELHQEIDSPYIIGVPLTEQQTIFIGRTDISAQIEQLLRDQRRPPLLLYGQRRMGKTSLLNNLGSLLPNTIVPLFVDLQGPATRATDHAGFLYNIARKMVDSAERQRGITLLPLTRDALKGDPFTRFDEWLDGVEGALDKNTALLTLDEFEALDRAIAKGRFDEEDVLGMLRNLIQHRPRFKILLAGSHTLEEFQRWASYLINVQVIHISYLKEAEARQLIEQPVKDFALRYEPEALQRVLELTRCHPFLVQLLCAEIVALKNEQAPTIRRLAKLADVEAAVPEALESGSFFFADIERNQIGALEPAGLEVLRFIAAQGEGAIVSQETLSRKFPNELDSTLNLLLRRELIEKEDEGYHFQVELIRRWFA